MGVGGFFSSIILKVWKGKTSCGVPGVSWNLDEMFDSYVLTVVTQ